MKKGTLALIAMAMLSTACADEKAIEARSVKAKELQAETGNTALWLTDFEAASEKARAEKKFLLVDFSGSDWCGWCMKLDKEVFSRKVFQEFAAAHLVPVLLDFPRAKPQPDAVKAQNRKLADHYKVEGFPTVLILKPDGQVVERTGYRPGGADAYVAFLKGILERAPAR